MTIVDLPHASSLDGFLDALRRELERALTLERPAPSFAAVVVAAHFRDPQRVPRRWVDEVVTWS